MRPTSRASLILWIGLLGMPLGAGCERTPSLEPAARPEPAAREDRLVVFAATSLRDAFTSVGEAFERAHPGVELTLNFAGTQELRTQLEHGAAVDVFASADQVHMEALVQASRATRPVVFARNEPVMVVAMEAAATIRSFADLPPPRAS
jgi:molybdate transport system substrate-binding protein